MKRILCPIGCRSDEGLSAPVIKRLKQSQFDVIILDLIPQDFGASYHLTEAMIPETRPDLVLITGDRVEMCAAAAAAFHNKVPIAHFYAGVINDPITTFDDVDRHCITLWSDIQFCENTAAAETVWDLLSSVALPHNNIFEVGISHLDDLEVDESKVPKERVYDGEGVFMTTPYDLVLYNTPLSPEQVSHDLTEIVNRLYSTEMILIGGNPDGMDWVKLNPVMKAVYPSLPRPQFLGLLKHCQRFITNSSAAIYEAPHFLKPEQIVMVGDRNKNRPKGPFKTGASDRIVEILKEYLK